MGGKLCAPSQKLHHETLYQNSQIQYLQECDNPAKQHLSTQFLNTTILASWNILKQKNFNSSKLQDLRDFSLNLKKQNSIQQKQQNSLENKEFFQFFKIVKPYKPALEHEYQNVQINVSNFIHLRNQNIQDYYKFDEKIGEGSFGNVYKCFDIKSQEVRAVKVLKKSGMNNKNKMGFIAEIDLFKTLDHPNIVKLYDIFFYSQHYYVVTEYCGGGTLQKILNEYKSQINQNFTKIVMRQLISVISYLNSKNIVHRDLKLDNIVLSRQVNKNNLLDDNSIKIIDFGTAAKIQLHRKNKSGLVGTVYYMAPEFVKGFFNQKCDIWSAGVIMFLLLFKKYPFIGKKQKEILASAANTQLNLKKLNQKTKYSQNAIQLLQQMLQKNYFKRISPALILKSNWIESSDKLRLSKQIQDETLKKLNSYKRHNNFISLIESFLIFKKTTQIQREQISKIFCQIDSNNSGLIEIQQLIEFYQKNMKDSSTNQIKELIQKIDKNKSGKIDFNQFINLMIDTKKMFMKETLKEAFQYIDKNKTGYIQKKQLKQVLKGCQKKQIQEMFSLIDQNQDNKIQFEQFFQYLMKYQD